MAAEEPSSTSAPPVPALVVDSEVVFATETERAFSVLLDALGLRWSYEPREFVLVTDSEGKPKCGFRPDFFLPDLNLYVELTMQKEHKRKNRKLRLMTEHYPDVRVILLGRKELELFGSCAA